MTTNRSAGGPSAGAFQNDRAANWYKGNAGWRTCTSCRGGSADAWTGGGRVDDLVCSTSLSDGGSRVGCCQGCRVIGGCPDGSDGAGAGHVFSDCRN